MKLSPRRIDELIELALDLMMETEHFHPIIWKDHLDDGTVTLDEIYWMRNNLEYDIEVRYEGDGSP